MAADVLAGVEDRTVGRGEGGGVGGAGGTAERLVLAQRGEGGEDGGLGALREHQPLGRATGAAHAAAFASPHGAIRHAREDVGRHNALDKLVGALAAAGQNAAEGFILSTARCSYEIVEKAVRAGATRLVTVSLPTSLAVERATAAGLSLWSLARDDSVLLVNHSKGL